MEQNPLIFNNILRQNNPQIIINQPFKLTFSNIINKIIFTKNCFIITFVLCILINFLIYNIFFQYNKETFSFTKFESEDNYFWLLFWMINIEIIMISWNFYFFLFSAIFKYDFSKGNGTIRSSIVEDLYKNPLGFVIIIYYYDSKFLKNSIDNSFWMMISIEYYFICFYLIQFYQHFYI